MKLVTFTHNGETRVAALENGNLIDLHAAYKAKLTSEGNLRATQIAEAYIPKDMNWVFTRWIRKYESSKRGNRLCTYEKP